MLGARLDALGHHVHVELVGQRHDAGAQVGVLGVVGNVLHEGTVQLEVVDRELAQVGHRREAGAEVVDRQHDAAPPEPGQDVDRELGIGHHHRLGQFHLQAAGRQRVPADGLEHIVRQLGAGQLAGREIHRHRHFPHALGAPAGDLAAGFVDHPAPQAQQQAKLLGQGNEAVGRHQAHARTVPADQGFETRHRAVAPHLRLVMQRKFARPHRRAQVALQRHPLGHGGAERARVEAVLVAPVVLGRIHRRLRPSEQFVGAVPVYPGEADAGAEGQVQGLLQHRIRLGQEGADLFDLVRQVLDRPGQRQREGELVAGNARQVADRDVALLQALADHLDQQVADRLAEIVVDVLELVEIEDDDRQPWRDLDGRQQVLVERGLEPQAVGQPGQGIGNALLFEPLAQAAQLGDLGREAEHAYRLAGQVEQDLARPEYVLVSLGVGHQLLGRLRLAGQHGAVVLLQRRDDVGRQEIAVGPSKQLVELHTENLEHAPVGVQVTPLEVLHEDGTVDVGEDRVDRRLRLMSSSRVRRSSVMSVEMPHRPITRRSASNSGSLTVRNTRRPRPGR